MTGHCIIITLFIYLFIYFIYIYLILQVSEKKAPVKPPKERTRRRKIRLTIQCKEQTTPWTSESNILTALSTLFTIKCPEATFLRETAVKRNETQLRMQYKCLSLIHI